MPTYITNNGETFEARNAAHLVAQMRQQSYSQFATTADYMNDMAKRLVLLDIKAHIPTSSPEAFVRGLLKCGFLKMSG